MKEKEIVQVPDIDSQMIEIVLVGGDLSKLSPSQRVSYYTNVCKSLGLNPLTRPFDYIVLNNKLTLYPRKDCTDQLRKIHNISIAKPDIKFQDDLVIVSVSGKTQDGREDAEIGVVNKKDMQGNLANALMKAVTKAKRRLTLSICGLGWLDETEVETINDAKVVNVTEDGEISTKAQLPRNDSPNRPLEPGRLLEAIYDTAEKYNPKNVVTDKDIQAIAACLEYIFSSEEKRHEFIAWLTGGEFVSIKELSVGIQWALYKWLKPTYDKNLTAFIPTDQFAFEEARAAMEEIENSFEMEEN